MDPRESRRWRAVVSKMKVSEVWRKKEFPHGGKRMGRKELREVRLALRAACMDWEEDYEALVNGLKDKSSEEGYETESLEDRSFPLSGFTTGLPNEIAMKAGGASEASKIVDIAKISAREKPTFVFQSSYSSDQDKVRNLRIGGVFIEKRNLDGKLSQHISDGLRRLPGADAASGVVLKELQEEVSQLCNYLAFQAGKGILADSLHLFQLPTLRHGYNSCDEDATSVPKEVFARVRKRTLAVIGRVHLNRAEEIPVSLWRFREKQLSIFEKQVLEPLIGRLPGGEFVSLNQYLPASHRDQLISLYGSVEEMAADPGELTEVVHILGEVRRAAIVAGLRHREYSFFKSLVSQMSGLDSFYEEEGKVQTLLDTLRTARRILLASDEQLTSLLGGSREFDKFLTLFGSMTHKSARKNLSYFSGLQNAVNVVKDLTREFGSIAQACKVSLQELQAANLFEDDKFLYEVFRRLKQVT